MTRWLELKVVSDAGPIIALSRIGKLKLLKRYFGRIFIPKEVYDQIVERGRGKPGSEEVEKYDWFEAKEVGNRIAVNSLSVDLEKGEAEAIILSLELEADLILMDDFNAREIAKAMGLSVLGTVGILVKASQDGIIENLKETLEELRRKGIRISNEVIEYALTLAGER